MSSSPFNSYKSCYNARNIGFFIAKFYNMEPTLVVQKFTNSGGFTEEAKRVVEEYFKSTGKKKTGGWKILSKTIILFGLFFLSYYVLLFTSVFWWAKIIICFLLGYYVIPGIGFNVMHDGSHKSFSEGRIGNYLASLSLNFLGANNTLWRTKHGVIHHTYTNLDGLDDDINAKPFLRLHEDQPWEPKHRNQYKWWYWGFFYSLLYPIWIWGTDYTKYFSRKISFKPIKFTLADRIVFWVSKVVYVGVFIALPVYYLGVWWWLLGYVIILPVCSFRISIIFQLAHVVIDVKHPQKDKNRRDEFFMHQASTTANFAVRNRWINWWVGGLNFQIEHHLFPEISHVHYPALHKELLPVYKKWNVPIAVYDSFGDAKRAHTLYLKKLSVP